MNKININNINNDSIKLLKLTELLKEEKEKGYSIKDISHKRFIALINSVTFFWATAFSLGNEAIISYSWIAISFLILSAITFLYWNYYTTSFKYRWEKYKEVGFDKEWINSNTLELIEEYECKFRIFNYSSLSFIINWLVKEIEPTDVCAVRKYLIDQILKRKQRSEGLLNPVIEIMEMTKLIEGKNNNYSKLYKEWVENLIKKLSNDDFIKNKNKLVDLVMNINDIDCKNELLKILENKFNEIGLNKIKEIELEDRFLKIKKMN